ncbi:MAG: hypothetical protein MR421_08200 [Prevotella sp.]|nr:hypothetical protein [Prevotella sp.]
MKKLILSIMAMMTIALNANAMSFTQAQREALFLTDKMAYELNLTDEQYDACYEINLDYLMSVSTVDDLYGTYWTRRNYDLGYVLLDWQLAAYRAASYFYRPLYWNAGCWHFGIYARYPRRTFYYFSHPTVYVSYRGGHSWRMNGGHSYYHGHQDRFRNNGVEHVGMRDRFDNRRFENTRHGNGRIESSRPGISNNNRQNIDRGNNRQNIDRGNNRQNVDRGNNRFGNVRQNSDNNSSRRNINRSFESRTNTMRQNGFTSDRGVRGSSTRVTVNRSNTSSPSRSFSSGGGSSRSVKSSSGGGIRSSSAAHRK